MACALVLLLGQRLEAALWLAYDLRSLVVESRAIVLAKEVSGGTVKTFVVQKVYQGALLPGMRVVVEDTYPRTGPWGQPMTFDPEAILFLGDVDPEKSQPLTHSIVHSGLRLLKDGRVYAFHQVSNPGGIDPFPLTRLPPPEADGSLRLDGGDPVTLGDFEGQIAEALLAVGAVKAALLKPDPIVSRDATLEVLARVYASEAAWRRQDGDHEWASIGPGDALVRLVVKRFRERRDTQAVLEVMVRTELYALDLEPRWLLPEATSKACPPRLRVAAIRALDIWHTDDTDLLSQVVELVGDGDADVRQAAIARIHHAHRGYTMNQHHRTPALDGFWSAALARVEALKATFTK